MNVLISLMYYRPHYSGMTVYAERLARALAVKGHQVTVLTSRFDPSLPGYEVRQGVTIIRPKVLMRISKGVIMPTLPYWAWKLVSKADVVNAHAPQPDAALVASISKLLGKPVVLTYQCDLRLPEGLIHYIVNQGSHLANRLSGQLADTIVSTSLDYAENSPFLSRYLDKVIAVQPPIQLAPVTPEDVAAFRSKYNLLPGQRIIGMAARLATEKGVEFLVEAMPKVLEKYPTARVLFAGQHQEVLGEEFYAQRLAPMINDLGDHWTFLGILPATEWSVFFHEAEVTVLPSINSTEAYGMVQVESMTCGTPVVVSDLPGVREPVRNTGMGLIVPPQNSDDLSKALVSILDKPNGYQGDIEKIKSHFAPETIASEYERIFDRLIMNRGDEP
ncbi:MAG: glycosyltransferase family 4 protein [Chloroflexota bacterium]|nr:MAG: glycosyltransferase family 4 protein [Chloroflexota bacterium]